MPDAAPQPPSENAIVAFFDVDNTLLRGASIFHLAKAAWRKRLITLPDILRFGWHQASFLFRGENHRHLSSIKDRGLALAGGHSEAAIALLATEIFERDIQPRLWPETVELAREHLRKGHEVWLITATPQLIAQVIADRLGLSGALGTLMESEQGILTGRLDGSVLHGEEKAIAARALTTKLRAEVRDCWAYSDSRNDIPLLTLVGNRVVVNPDAALARHAKANQWPVLQLKRASIRAAQRRVRREGRAVKPGAIAPAIARPQRRVSLRTRFRVSGSKKR